MTDKLPPNLLALFAPRPPLRWVPPSDYPAEERKTANPSGVAGFLGALKDYKDKDNYVPTESWLQARDRKKLEKKAALEKLLAEVPETYKPSEDPNIRGDAFKTLIVCRLSYQATEEDLEREFGRIGNIERIRIVRDTHADEHPNKKKKPHRGYAFIVFEREKDMRAALDQLQGISLHGRRVKLDVERGRTVPGWRPRRLGGGLGGRGYTSAATMRPNGFGPPSDFGGGFRGGFRGGRGGFRGGDRGGFRGGFDRPRGGGFGGRDRFGGPPNAPSGPGSASGGYGGRSDRDRNDYRGGGGFGRDDRSGGGYRGSGGFDRSSGSNNEPLGSRDRDRGDRGGGGGYRDRGADDRRGGYDDRRGDDRRGGDDSRKRPYEGGSGYEGERKLRRY